MTINASVYRNTRFELRSVQQEANSFKVVCSERKQTPMLVGSRVVASRTPALDLGEAMFTDEEMRQVHAVLELIEVKFASAYEAYAKDPAHAHNMVAEAAAAETRLVAARAELAKVEAETARKRTGKP